MAKELARALDYIYLDTGAMYRAVTLHCLRQSLFSFEGTLDTDALATQIGDIEISFRLNPETHRPETYLNGENVERAIRGMEVASRVSQVAAIPFVREALVAQQRALGREKGIVMDGRDIGTTVFPNAELKVFVTASAEIRAQRRYDELLAKGEPASFEEILQNVKARDEQDMSRTVSPLRKAEDALLLDNSQMTKVEQTEWLLEVVRGKLNAGK